MNPILSELEETLSRFGPTPEAFVKVLDRVLAVFDCQVGTVHRLNPQSGRLELIAERGLPSKLLPVVGDIPVGKGMAGLAAERRQSVQVCNLQDDTSGRARPGAKDTRMEGCLAVPMLAEGALRGVLGVAKPEIYEFKPEEITALETIAEALAGYL